MTPAAISSDDRTAIISKSPSFKPDSYSITTMDNVDQFAPLIVSEILKEDPDQFALALAHEVRNPLTNINLSVKLLESAIKDNDLKVYLDIIARSSIRINNLIKEFLKYRVQDEARTEKHSIHQLIDEVVEMTEDRIMLKNITIKKDYLANDFKILLNRPQMKIALINIIINAIDSMDSENGELTLITKSINGKYMIQIEDNGCGISSINLKKIFTPYFTNKSGGLGLGLATTYDILQLNKVGLNVESKEGEGTRFVLSFEKDRLYKRFIN